MIKVYTTNKVFASRAKMDLKENAGLDLYIDLSSGVSKAFSFPQEDSVKPEITLDGTTLKIYPIAGLTSYPFVAHVRTGVYLELPKGVHAVVSGRSGRFFKDHIDVFRGIIDSSYRGEIVVGLIFYRKTPIYLDINNAIAQLIFLDNTSISNLNLKFVECVEDLGNSERGTRGFGSSDVLK